MRDSGRSPARGRSRWLVLAFAAAATLVWGVWPRAEATPSRVEQLQTICSAPGGDCRRLLAFEELASINTRSSRDALNDLAGASDDRVAVMAIGTLGRRDQSGARTKIQDVYEDTNRSDGVRAAALAAYCRLQAADGKEWADCKSWVKQKAGTNQQLRDAYAALKAKFWAEEADND